MANYSFNEHGVTVGDITVPWSEIENYQTDQAIQSYILVKLETQYARDEYYNHFLIKKNEWEDFAKLLKDNNVTTTCLGEIAGKHSNVTFYWDDPSSVQVIEDKQAIRKFYNRHNYHDSNTDSDFVFATREENGWW